MGTTLSNCLQPSEHTHIPKLSSLTEKLETRLEGDNLSCLPTTSISPLCMQQHYKTMGLSITRVESPEEVETGQKKQGLKFVAGITAHQGVASLTRDANTNTSASCVDSVDMGNCPVANESREDKLGLKPKYLRQNLWSLKAESRMIASEWMESAEPLLQPPTCEYENLPICQSISEQ